MAEHKGAHHEGKHHHGDSKGKGASVPVHYPNAMGFPHSEIKQATAHKKG